MSNDQVMVFADIGFQQTDFTGDPQGQTITNQFDNDKTLANTEWVNGRGVAYSNVLSVTGSSSLALNDIGKLVHLSGAGNYTVTLPDFSLASLGSGIHFILTDDIQVILLGAASQTIKTKDAAGAASITLRKGEAVHLIKISSTQWLQSLHHDADLSVIANLSGTSGFLKKSAADSWTLDTSTYLTGNQTITISGDASGSGTTSIPITLATTGVSAGTYNNSATQVTPITVDTKGRITATGSPITIAPAFSSVTGKPTNLAGYGITDAAPLSHTTDNTVHLTSAQNTWIDAITATSTEVNYLVGVTSAIQTQLNNKQPLDADLTSIAALSGTSGFLKKTAADTWAIDTSLSFLANGMPAYVESTGSKTVSITPFELEFALSGGNRNIYLQFGDGTNSSATEGIVLPANMTLIGIYANFGSVPLLGATVEVRVNGSSTATDTLSCAGGTDVSYYGAKSTNYNSGDRIAVYGSAAANFNNIIVKLLFAWR